MSGVKGRSGRKSLRDEEKRLRIIDKAWDTIEKYLNDENIDISKRAWLAKNVVVKDMPEKLTDGDGDPLPRPVFNIFGAKSELLCSEESDTGTRIP